MGRQADFKSYQPLKFGVSREPVAIVVKYADATSKHKKHHLVSLERFKDNPEPESMLAYIYRKHGPYFPETTVSYRFVAKLVAKLVDKVKSKPSADFSKKSVAKQENIRNTKEPTTIGLIEERRYIVGTPSNKWGTQDSRKLVSPASPQDPSINEQEEIIDDIEDEDTLRSEDLGLNQHKMSQSKLAEEQLPSLYNNRSLSKSRVSNLLDSKKTFDKRTANELKDSAPRSDRDKIFEQSGTKFPYKKENLPGLKKSGSDNFDDFDDFDDIDVDVPRKNPSGLKKSQTKSSKKHDDFDDFDDFDDIQSRKSKLKSKPQTFDDFDEIDDGFDDIVDEEEEVKPQPGMKDTKTTNDTNAFQSKLSDLNLDYRTLDLNKLKDEEVELVKKTMDANFKQLKPGDEGYVYDKSISFEPEVSNDWDD